MRKRLVVSDAAKSDLRGIRDYIAKDSPKAAEAFIADLTNKMNWIAEADFTDSPRDHIGRGLRGFPYRNRCIYFRSFPDRIVIVRVLHQAQDVDHQPFGGTDRV
jgi:toxin ParE1/3/4